MRTIIAGSRGVSDLETVRQAMRECGWTPSYTLSGAARGVDVLGEMWARENSIPFLRFPAKWDAEGKVAGHNRNIVMAENADALVAIWDGRSRGTEDMIRIARRKGLMVYVYQVG